MRVRWGFLAVLLAAHPVDLRAGQTCTYQSKLYSDQAIVPVGAACQRCDNGKWKSLTGKFCGPCTSKQSTKTTKPPGKSVRESPPCLYGATEDLGEGVYDDTAVERNGKMCQRCNSGIWTDLDGCAECGDARKK